MADKIKIKRGLKANLPILDDGEMAFCTDTNELYIGTTTGNILLNGGGTGGGDPGGGGGTLANVTNLTVPNVTAYSAELSWTASSGATSYDIEKNGVLLDNTTNTTYVAIGLTAETTYTFTVKAKNATTTASGASVQATPMADTETPAPTVVYSKDTFTRANSTTTLGSDETGKTWTYYQQPHVWGIQNNQAYPVTIDANDPVHIQSGVSDNIAIEIRVAVFSSTQQIMYRSSNKDNYFVWEGNEVYRTSNDVWSSKGVITPSIANGDLLRIELRGDEHKIFVNGVLKLTFTDATHMTATNHGFSTASSTTRIDDWLIESLSVTAPTDSTATANETVKTWIGGFE